MIDNKHSTDEGRDHDTDDRSPHPHRRWTGFLAHRWPTAVGIAVVALTAFDLRIDVESISFLSALVVIMPLVYVGAAVLERRRFAWVVLLVAIAALVLTQVLDLKINLVLVFLVVALAFLVVGVARGQLRRPGGLTLQTAGMLAFGATALAAFYVDPDLGGYLVAFALLGHAAWDAIHYVRNRVVPRSYAEFCAVFDLLLGAAILFVLFMR
jgi:hypothetical protein